MTGNPISTLFESPTCKLDEKQCNCGLLGNSLSFQSFYTRLDDNPSQYILFTTCISVGNLQQGGELKVIYNKSLITGNFHLISFLCWSILYSVNYRENLNDGDEHDNVVDDGADDAENSNNNNNDDDDDDDDCSGGITGCSGKGADDNSVRNSL